MKTDGDVAYVDEDVDADRGSVKRSECWFREARVLQVLLLRLMIANQFCDEGSLAFL